MAASDYRFDLVREDADPLADQSVLERRPFASRGSSFKDDARRFVPGQALTVAINTSIAVGEPLLITGEPGTGKTQAAYYAAWKLAIEPVIHFQMKSDSTAQDLLYHFDTVRYSTMPRPGRTEPCYIERRAFWEAMDSAYPRVLVIDEIDKAPRDFPNDLLHELDKMEFKVIETGKLIQAPAARRPMVFITSNSERRLPEPFLRCCVYHHIRFDNSLIEHTVEAHRDDYRNLSPEFLKLAIRRFLRLREQPLRKQPATGELLVWLRVLALAVGTYPLQLEEDLHKLPYLSTLLKDHQDLEGTWVSGRRHRASPPPDASLGAALTPLVTLHPRDFLKSRDSDRGFDFGAGSCASANGQTGLHRH